MYCPTGVTEIQRYRYGSQTTLQNMYTCSEEHFLPIPFVVASSLTVFLSYIIHITRKTMRDDATLIVYYLKLAL